MRIVVATIVAMALGACASAPSASVSPSASSPASASPSPSATTSPTSEPTATDRPTAEPTTGDWDDFQEHTEGAAGEMGTLLLEVHQVVEDDPPSADIDLSLLGLQVMTWASAEKEWVRENPPAACYADTWAAYSEAVDLVYSAGSELTEAIDDLGPAVTQYQFLVSAADDAFGEAVSARESVNC